MKTFFLATVVSVLMISASIAQTTAPSTNSTRAPDASTSNSGDKAEAAGNNNQAVATTSANSDQPANGSNSFTMNEAKSRLENNGYTNISNLQKDNNGVWRGTAQKGGASEQVWVDYKGNIGISK